MDVSVQQLTAQGDGNKLSTGIPPLLITEGPLRSNPLLISRSNASDLDVGKSDVVQNLLPAQDSVDCETLLALFLFSLYRLTQIDSFSIPIYLIGKNSRGTAKTLYFTAGDSLPEIRARVRTRLETPGHSITEDTNKDTEKNLQASFAVFLFDHNCDDTNSEDLPPEIIDCHKRAETFATLVIRAKFNRTRVRFSWISSFPQDASNPYQAVMAYTERLLDTYLEDPATDLYHVNLVGRHELQKQKQFASDIIEPTDHLPVIRQFEQMAERVPLNPAVITDEITLSYRQLNNLSNLMSQRLTEAGVTEGSYVGVLVQPSVELFACILAIHKIGAIYLPMDATFPESRLKTILEIAPTALLLHDSSTEDIAVSLGRKKLCVEKLRSLALSEHDEPNPDFKVAADSTSHIFFTSGTTGAPKGILATHRNFSHSLFAGIRRYGFCSDDRFIAIARCTFSISMFEYFTALTLGAPVTLLDKKAITNPAILAGELSNATVAHMVPSLLRQVIEFLKSDGHRSVPGIRYLLTGGDMVPVEVLTDARTSFPDARIFVNYGSSEISCMGCTYEISRAKGKIRTKVGKPHPNMRIRILDNNRNLMPIGLCGELYFSGDGVVPGYLNRADLNRNKFVDIDGDRYFAIGDIGRFDSDGNIELLGREDFQIKINGIRIEPPEIETRLKQLDGIRDCVVVGRFIGSSKQASLVAYLVTDSSLEKASAISEYLANYLPEYMCPSVYVVLPRLPTNYNGKIDRSQLPPPSIKNILSSNSTDTSTSNLEQELIEIWEASFELDGLHPHHDFFEIGGSSLKAISMLTQVRLRFGREITLTHFLANRTIRKLASILEEQKPIEQGENISVLKEGDESLPALFCLNGSVQYRELATTIDIPNRVAAVTLREEEEIISDGARSGAFEAISDFSRITQKYLEAIKEFQPHGPYFLTGASFGGLIAFEVARCFLEQGEEVALIGLYDTWTPGYRDKARPIKRLQIGLSKIREFGLSQIRTYGNRAVAILLGKQNTGTTSLESLDIRAVLRTTALATYKLKPLQHKVVLFNANDRPRYYGEPNEPHLGWKRYVNDIEVCKVPGTHTGILKYPHVKYLARRLEKAFSPT